MFTIGAVGGLICRLKRDLETECKQWDQWICLGLHKGNQLVTADERDDSFRWICQLSERLALAPDTIALAACVLDRTLFTTRVQTKYLQCVALSALYIACKICEEPEAVPPVPELVRESGCICSVQELVRMERVLLKRINWDLNLVTPYTFLQLMLAIGAPQNSHILMQTFRPLIELVSSSHSLTSGYRPSTLALAMFSIVLEWQRYPNWLAMTLNMEELIGITADKLIICREHMTEILRKRNANNVWSSANDEAENMEIENEYDRNNNNCNIFVENRTTTAMDAGVNNHATPLFCSKENVSPCDSFENGRVRKRQRRKSRGGDAQQHRRADDRMAYGGSALIRAKSASEQVVIDDIYDAVRVLYGMSS